MASNERTELQTQLPNRFNYVYSCDLQANIEIKICHLEGTFPKKNYEEIINDQDLYLKEYENIRSETSEKKGSHLYVTCQIFAHDKAISLPVQTKYCYYKSTAVLHAWNEWLKLPLRYCDIPRNSMLAITIWDIYGLGKARPIGGTSLSLFGKYGTFRQGQRDLTIWPEVHADGRTNTSTPSKVKTAKNAETTRLIKLAKKHKDGHIPKVDWMDRLVFREIEMIREQEKQAGSLFLMVEFQDVTHHDINYTVVYFEENSDAALQVRTHPQIILLPDHELTEQNLVEEKHRKLARSVRSGQHELKPNAAMRDQLAMIVNYPPSKQLTSEEEDIVWKFRHYLSSQKKALTKFLRSVKWEGEGERVIALQLLHKWQPIDVSDALELLSPHFQNTTVRSYAVKRLSEAPDDDLVLYLLQLVQALKYENFNNIKADYEKAKRQDARLHMQQQASVNEARNTEDTQSEHSNSSASIHSQQLIDEMDLATFLIKRACKNSSLANYFYWYLLVECNEEHSSDPERRKSSEMYITVMKRFSYALLRGDRQCRLRRSQLAGQQKFVDKLVMMMSTIQKDTSNRKRKIDKLRALLADSDSSGYNFQSFDPLPLPLDPDVKICGIVAEKATLFKSALMPAKFTFICTDKTTYTAIFKHGDDLRQDQLILQIIRLMDRLLQKENLDLKLTPFKVLPTKSDHGFLQFVDSKPVAEVLATEGSIQNFFRKCHPNPDHPFGIERDVMDTYIKSCAGYCVITYILGIGDRHLDNLLLVNNGKLFHVDFGYILGRDPKPLPPPMKLSKEMVEAMGGLQSEQYKEFRKHCYTAFLHLRRHANLILNLFSLMTDASVPDIALEPDKTVKKVEDKLCLNLSDEEAVHHMQGLIDESVSALFAAVAEQIHKLAQYWRK